MFADRRLQPHSAATRLTAALIWLGGGHRRELGERYEQSTHALAGVIVLLTAWIAALVVGLAVAASTGWPIPLVLLTALTFGLLSGAIVRAIANGPQRGALGVVGRGAVALAVGAVVGELATVVLFAGSIDSRLNEQAARHADSAPAVAEASGELDSLHARGNALDDAVHSARQHLDEALVVARCEFNPSPACPQTRITGVAGAGPETRTANERLASAQQELGSALAARDGQSGGLKTEISAGQTALAAARGAALADADHGLGARWKAMHEYTTADGAALVVRLFAIAFFTLLSLLPLILRLWRGETSNERSSAAQAERERAELQADTAIAVKRAEVRAAVERLWAEQELTRAQLAVEAQNEIDHARYRHTVLEATEAPVMVSAQRDFDPTAPANVPIGAPDAPALPAAPQADPPPNLPATVPSARVDSATDGGGSLIPTIPDVTRAAARWIRPLVPPVVARVVETTTQPLRGARQVFEEVEEITFAFRRRRTVTVESEHGAEQPAQRASVPSGATQTSHPIDASFVRADEGGEPRHRDSLDATDQHKRSAVLPGRSRQELEQRDGPPELT